jgi:RNA polymerase sigma factor (sigma-70 family)
MGSPLPGGFRTTRWNVVLAAARGEGEGSRDALSSLCEDYWYPVYAFVRRQGFGAEEARDLTQGYFARLIERGGLQSVRPELGRFRSFLLASVRHYLSNERDRDHARKRAPEKPLVSLDASAEDRYLSEPADTVTPEIVFEQKWAWTVFERTLRRLRAEWIGDERMRRFRALSRALTGEEPAPSYRELASALEMTEDAVKVTVHRLRQRFGELLRDEIAQTVNDPAEVDDELHHLLSVRRSL